VPGDAAIGCMLIETAVFVSPVQSLATQLNCGLGRAAADDEVDADEPVEEDRSPDIVPAVVASVLAGEDAPNVDVDPVPETVEGGKSDGECGPVLTGEAVPVLLDLGVETPEEASEMLVDGTAVVLLDESAELDISRTAA
jgi:hypothetical protein